MGLGLLQELCATTTPTHGQDTMTYLGGQKHDGIVLIFITHTKRGEIKCQDPGMYRVTNFPPTAIGIAVKDVLTPTTKLCRVAT